MSVTSETSTTQVLGASTAAIGGIAMLPETGNGFITKILPILAITLGILTITSFIITRLIRRVS